MKRVWVGKGGLMRKMFLVVGLMMLAISWAWAYEVPTKFYCDKCGQDITYQLAIGGVEARNEFREIRWDWKHNVNPFDRDNMKIHLCNKHSNELSQLIKKWLKEKGGK